LNDKKTAPIVLHSPVSFTKRPEIATDWIGIKTGDLSKEIRFAFHHSIDKKGIFRPELFVHVNGKSLSSKKWGFSWGWMARPFHGCRGVKYRRPTLFERTTHYISLLSTVPL
jgi:hypothetical protein